MTSERLDQEVIDSELTDDEIGFFKSEIERLGKDFSILRNAVVETTDENHLLVDSYEIAPGIEVCETISRVVHYRAYSIGEWRTICNYPFEPDDADVFWEGKSFHGNAVVPEILIREVQKSVPAMFDGEIRRPVHVMLKEGK